MRNDIIVQFLKVGESAKCFSCGAENIIPDTAIETSQKPEYGVEKEVKSQGINATVTRPLPKNLGFNWGAFFLAPIWLLFHGEVGAGIALMVLNLILSAARGFGFPITLAIAIYVGIKGNEIAWKHKKYGSLEELKKKQREWAIAGWMVGVPIIIFLIIVCLALLNVLK